jgi:hypothetical protein
MSQGNPGQLSPAWEDALKTAASRRSMPHYKPAALLTMLDMVQGSRGLQDRIHFAEFEDRFRKGSDKCASGSLSAVNSALKARARLRRQSRSRRSISPRRD